MIVIEGYGITMLIWFVFILATTFSWGYAYLADSEDSSITVMYGRHFISLVFALALCWWLIGTYEAPFFTEPYLGAAVLFYILSSVSLSTTCWLLSVRLESIRVAALKTDPEYKVIGMTYETEWVTFATIQTIVVLVWGAHEWRLYI